MIFREIPASPKWTDKLIALSGQWEAEDSCRGYRANTREDIEGRRIFAAIQAGELAAYLFGVCGKSERADSVMPALTPYFELEELYVRPALRSQGIGRRLFYYAQRCLRNEARFILLSTATKDMEPILRFYTQRAGMTFWNARLFKAIGPGAAFSPDEKEG